MGTIVFDTLAYSRAMRKAGFSEEQASIMAEAQNAAFTEMREGGQLATRADILRLEKQIAEMETRLTKAFHTALFGFTGVIAACIAIAVAILK